MQPERLRRDAANPEFHPDDIDLDERCRGAVGPCREIDLVVLLPEALDITSALEQPCLAEQRDIGLVGIGLEDQPDLPLAAQLVRLARTAVGDEADDPAVFT